MVIPVMGITDPFAAVNRRRMEEAVPPILTYCECLIAGENVLEEPSCHCSPASN